MAKMIPILSLLSLLSIIPSTLAKIHGGCVWTRISSPNRQCNLRGASYKGVAVIPEYISQPEGNFTAMDMCEFACADNVNCVSWSFMTINNKCQLYRKPIREIGFEPQHDSKRIYSDRICIGGEPVPCGKSGNSVFKANFDNGPKFAMKPSQVGSGPKYWAVKGPPRCYVNSGDSAMFARAPADSSISMTTDLILDKIGGTYVLTYDYVYEDYDPAHIIFGYLYQTDKDGGLSQVFQLARAEDQDAVNFWQRGRFSFTTQRTKKYRLQINFETIPGFPSEKRVPWRMDNVCLVLA